MIAWCWWQSDVGVMRFGWQKWKNSKIPHNCHPYLSPKSVINIDSILNSILTIDFSAFRFKSWKFHGRKLWKETWSAPRKASIIESCTAVASRCFEATSKAKTNKIWISWSYCDQDWTDNGSSYQEKRTNWGNLRQ